jgi:hypothetical protein
MLRQTLRTTPQLMAHRHLEDADHGVDATLRAWFGTGKPTRLPDV